MDADLNSKEEPGGKFLVADDVSLEDDLVVADAVDEFHDSGHEDTLLPKKKPGNAGVKDKRLDELLERLGNFHLLLLQSLDIL